MMLRSAAVVAGLALGLPTGSAKADLLHFQYDGSSEFSFNLDSSPTPNLSGDYYIKFLFDSANDGNLTNGAAAFSVYFLTQDQGGGIATSGTFQIRATGEQVFSGNTDTPQFSPGVFKLFDQTSNMPSTLTVTLSTVPLPASAPMFGAALLGLAGLGYAAKRKKAAAAA